MSATAAPDFQLFQLGDFELETGSVLQQAAIAYQISGTPSPGVLPILTCAAFSQHYNDLAYLRQKGRALDPSRRWIIHTELIANGRSTSPSNAIQAQRGPLFPKVSIRDNVRMQRRLLEFLNVERVFAAVGASMGAQQAGQWCVSYPDTVERAVLIAGSCRATLHAQLFLHSLVSCIKSDPEFNDGNYVRPPLEGLSRMSETWAPWALSPQFYFRQEYLKYDDTHADSLEEFLAKWRTRYHAKDANNLLSHLDTWSRHNVGSTPEYDGSVEKALAAVKAAVLFLPSSSDAYFNVADVKAEAALIEKSKVHVIESISGHAAAFGRCADDQEQISGAIEQFFSH